MGVTCVARIKTYKLDASKLLPIDASLRLSAHILASHKCIGSDCGNGLLRYSNQFVID